MDGGVNNLDLPCAPIRGYSDNIVYIRPQINCSNLKLKRTQYNNHMIKDFELMKKVTFKPISMNMLTEHVVTILRNLLPSRVKRIPFHIWRKYHYPRKGFLSLYILLVLWSEADFPSFLFTQMQQYISFVMVFSLQKVEDRAQTWLLWSPFRTKLSEENFKKLL